MGPEGSAEQTREPWVQLQQQQRAETAHRAEGFVALQAEDSGSDATDARNQSSTNAEGTDGLLKGLEELLRLLSNALGAEISRSMDTTSVAIYDLEAVETRNSSVREATSTRCR